MRSLSFERSSVFALVAQTLWQVGPSVKKLSDDPEFSFESHIDLRSDEFCSKLIECLSEFLENISKNWKKHSQLQIVIIIVLRIFSLSSKLMRSKAKKLLKRCRCIAEEWAKKIEIKLSKMMASAVTDVEQVRLKLVDVAAFAALTFDVDECHGNLVINKDTLVTWLHALARIHDNILLKKGFLDLERVNLLRRVRLTGLRFEKTSIKVLASNSAEIFNKLLQLCWSDSKRGICKDDWTPYLPPARQWYHNVFEVATRGSVTLQISILSGAFLVDGNPVGRLPESIIASPDYERCFGTNIFEVQPAAERSGTFVSLHTTQGSVFTFSLRDHGLVVVERLQEGDEYELIPSRIFEGNFPDHFVSNYSHWLCKKTKVLYFRPVKFDNCNFFKADSDEHFPYQFDLKQRTLFHLQRKRYLVDIRSDTFNEVYHSGCIHRLELKRNVHLWRYIEEFDNKVSIEKFSLSVEIPRMDLCFIVDEKTGKLFSREHPGLMVAKHQGDFGTLIGLKSGLLLCEYEPQVNADLLGHHRVLLLPYAEKIDFAESQSTCGQCVIIDFNKLFSPPYFAYSINDRLCELRGPSNQEVWLYLALLHAMTSSSLPDHFTGLTGTESSMRLLQIGRSFSCRPLTSQALHVLECISKLAPTRNFYPQHLKQTQTVTCLPNLQSSYGYEGLVFASQLVIQNSEWYKELFTPNVQEHVRKTIPDNDSITLVKRAYWRNRSYLNPCARLNAESERNIGGSPLRVRAWTYDYDANKTEIKWSKFLMETHYLSKGIRLDPSSNLWCTVQKKSQIKPTENIAFSSVSGWRKITLPDNYLQLYELAQNAHEEKFCRFQFSLLLSFLAFNGENIDLLFSLLAVAIMGINVNPPSVRIYDHLEETDFLTSAIRSAIKEEIVPFDSYSSQLSYYYSENKKKEIYKKYRKKAKEALGDFAKNQWILKQANFNSSFNDIVNVCNLEQKINSLFERWTNNSALKSFFTEIETKIREWRPCFQLPTANLSNLNDSVPSFNINQSVHGHGMQNSLKSIDLIFPIRDLPDNQETVVLYRMQTTLNYEKVNRKSKQNKNHFKAILSLFHDLDIKDDAVFEYMSSALKTSSEYFSKNKELTLVEESENNDILEKCRKFLNTNSLKSRLWWEDVQDSMKPDYYDDVGHALVAGGLWRRFSQVVIIPCILPLPSFSCGLLAIDDKNAIPTNVIDRIGAMIVCWTAEQRALRILKLLRDKTPPAILSQEIFNVGHENWIPSENPEWLILELEGNFLIRPMQVDIARSMMNAKENFVQQLNMGEGKTSVIVPLLAVSLSNPDQLARVTILRSLLHTNFEALVDKLGGLLNRRVYTVPCRRDIKLNASKVLDIHQECMAGRGLMLTTPEYRLSLDLKTLEHCRKGDADAMQLYNLRCWLREHARDVLDEADEILNVKYQVVYTLGNQLLVDGGEQRWIIAQAVLKLVNKYAAELFQQYGQERFEYKRDEKRGCDSFSNIRFINNDTEMYERLCCYIVDSILENKVPEVSLAAKLCQQDKIYARSYILSNDLQHEDLNKIFVKNPILQEELLILRGILSFEVLHMVLQKRWRVSFGVNTVGTTSQMAVPFRAKDVAAERTEFGHPDVAIILTQISYYMSGLNDAQMDDVFKRLDNCSYKHAEYERWIDAIGIDKVPKSLRSLNGVNLDDIEQKETLYSLLCYSMNVVNFWLSRAVFPRESKQFPHKISMSAWDLCLSKNKFDSGADKPTTGFSGTNESQLLLPLTIKQRDLPQILGTNAMVLSNLLRSVNNSYYHFGPCADTLDEDILNKAVETGARVLLDVGALMLQMDNKKVAQEWLKKLSGTTNISAAVFFGKDDRLMVLDRQDHLCSFTFSPYNDQLDHCVVYLDDIHTRGTDLRFPFNTLACVTLGKGLTKDRLVQACMRMRLLGKGHSVYFSAANDVHISITKQMKSLHRVPEAADILRWVLKNSCDFVRDGLMHWSSHGLIRSIKDAAESSVKNASLNMHQITSDDLKELGKNCTEDEVLKLLNQYGGSRMLESVSIIAKRNLNSKVIRVKKHFVEDLDKSNYFCEIINSIGEDVVSHCNRFVSTYQRYADINDDEQERELEVELEEEIQIYRPGPQTPHKPSVSEELLTLAQTGFLRREFLYSIVTIDKIFDDTNKLSEFFLRDGWSPDLLVSKEFITVIENADCENGDEYLFEVSWIIIVDPKPHLSQTTYILISSFEANELLSIFRSAEENHGVRLQMFAPRIRRGQSIFINERALAVPHSKPPGIDYCLIAQLSVLGGGLFLTRKPIKRLIVTF